MTSARRRAEEALRMFDRTATPKPHEVYLYRAIAALREILAEEAPPAADEVREAMESEVRQLRRLQRAEALLLDIWDAWHREGHEPTETIDAAIDRLGDWRWNEGYDPYNPPLRPDPRKALAARGGAE